MNLLERITKLASVEELDESKLKLEELKKFIREKMKPNTSQLVNTEISLVYDAQNRLTELTLEIEYITPENPINGMVPRVSEYYIVYDGI